MSKMDDLRAMREARYEQRMARAAKASKAAKPTTAPKPVQRPSAARDEVPPPTADAEEELCGHRSMNGRTCTREQGHAAKSHRYS